MEVLMALVVVSILIQAVVEGVKGALGKWDWISLRWARSCAPLAGIDAFGLLGVPLAVPYVGSVLTGLIVGRGATAVYDVWRRIKGDKDTGPPNDPVNPG